MKLDRIIAVRTEKTVYRNGDDCVKIFNKEYSKSDVLDEALNQARAEETGLNIPKIKEVTVFDGKWAIVSEFISGKTLARLMEEEPKRKNEYISLFVDIQLSVHAKECPLLTDLKNKIDREISASELDTKMKERLHSRLECMPDHKKLCHGDFEPSNIIISEDGRPYIVDWAHATHGNASADAARTYLLFRLAGDIDGAECYLESFCKKSNTEKQYVRKWISIVAASQSAKENENRRQSLLSWVDVFDYE